MNRLNLGLFNFNIKGISPINYVTRKTAFIIIYCITLKKNQKNELS